MVRSSIIWLCVLAALLLPARLWAAVADQIHFSGFASFVAAKSFKEDAPWGDATSTIPYKAELRDYTKLGFRVSVDLHDKLSFTTQVLSEGQNDFKPEFDWIFISYNITPDFVLHIGKYVTAYYMYSDYNDISYAYHWLEAPGAVYGTNINKTLEGVKLVWDTSLSPNWASELSIMVGKDKNNLEKVGVKEAELTMHSALGFAWQVEHDWLAVRLSYMATRTSADLKNSSLDSQFILAQLFSDNPDLANSDIFSDQQLQKTLNWDRTSGYATSIGASTHFNHFFTVTELTYSDLRNTFAIGSQFAGYFTLGTYLPHNLTLALTLYKKQNQANKKIKSSIDKAVQASADSATAEQVGIYLHNRLNAVQSRDREGFTLSGRWDFHDKAALKAEYMYEWQTRYSRIPNASSINKRQRTTPHAVRVGVDLAF